MLWKFCMDTVACVGGHQTFHNAEQLIDLSGLFFKFHLMSIHCCVVSGFSDVLGQAVIHVGVFSSWYEGVRELGGRFGVDLNDCGMKKFVEVAER
jgi:hypothetical protein